ncbi:MAG: hypothetical protein ABFS46_06190 [Myxococcota bacterium]
MNGLALHWARGDFRAPLVCELEGVAHRGFRRIAVDVGPRQIKPPVNRLRFYDLDIPPEAACVTETRGPTPNVIGFLSFLRRGPPRPDMAQREFTSILKREGGFSYDVARGRLRILSPGSEEREIDFQGGTVRFSKIRRGSDDWRRLAEFPAQRKLKLVVEAPDGTRLEFDLVSSEQH